MICYRKCLSYLEKPKGSEEKKIIQFINNIDLIGKMIDANDDILQRMRTAKLDGEAKRWHKNNLALTNGENLSY